MVLQNSDYNVDCDVRCHILDLFLKCSMEQSDVSRRQLFTLHVAIIIKAEIKFKFFKGCQKRPGLASE